MSKRKIIAGLFMIMFLGSILGAQTEVSQLELGLKNESGAERLKLLEKLVDHFAKIAPRKAILYGEETLELIKQFPGIIDEAGFLVKMSRIQIGQSNYLKVIEYADRSEKIALEKGNKTILVDSYICKGRAYKYLCNYKESLYYMEKASTLLEHTKDYSKLGECYNNIGLVYRRMGDYPTALSFFLKAGDIFDTQDDKGSFSSLYNNIGLIYQDMGNLNKALEYFQKSLKIDNSQKDIEGIAIGEENVARIFDLQGKSRESMSLLKKSLSIFEKLGSKKNISNCLVSLGDYYMHRENFKKAHDYYRRALKIKEEIKDEYGLLDPLIKQSQVHRKTGQYTIALLPLTRAKTLAEKIQSHIFIPRIYLQLSDLYGEMNDFKMALDFYKKHKEATDLYLNEQTIRKLNELNTRFETERKEKEISLLKKDREIRDLVLIRQKSLIFFLVIISILALAVTIGIYKRLRLKARVNKELVKYQEHLSELVEERTSALKEAQVELVRNERLAVLGQLTATVAHEIRNPLGAARASIFSIETAMKSNNFDRVHQALKLAEYNIVRCDTIIDDLLNFTRRRELCFELIPIDSWIENILDRHPLPVGIVCKRELDSGVRIAIDSERLLRAITNVLNNAVEALQERDAPGNHLTVSSGVNTDSQRLEIRFIDTGPGIPSFNLGKIFEPLFTTKRYGFGLGLAVVKNIMEEHGGGVEIHSEAGIGTTVTLWLPFK